MIKFGLLTAVSFVAGTVPDVTVYCTALVSDCKSHSIGSVDLCLQILNKTDLGDIEDDNKDTIGCRYKYLANATYNTTEKCRYAGPSGGGRCGSMLKTVCRVATEVCTGVSGTPYATAADCELGLKPSELNLGSRQGGDAATEDSLECRLYHAYASLIDTANPHCTHWNQTSANCAGPIMPSAAHYCDLLESNCMTAASQQFADKAQCLNVAAGYVNDMGMRDARASNTGNNLGCREYHAVAAMTDKKHCGHAGPTGGNACGTTVQAWSTLLAASPCADNTVSNVVKIVAPTTVNNAVPTGYVTEGVNTPIYNYNLDKSGNTQACRIYHLSVASAGGATATTHCPHGTLSGGGACGSNLVENLCSLIQTACTFGPDTWKFATKQACVDGLTNSSAFPIAMGAPTSTDGNNYACRFYHAGVAASFLAGGSNYNASKMDEATAGNKLHCGHVLKNPIGAGGCGTAAPAPTSKPSSASSLSIMLSGVAVAISVLSL